MSCQESPATRTVRRSTSAELTAFIYLNFAASPLKARDVRVSVCVGRVAKRRVDSGAVAHSRSRVHSVLITEQ
jgi:hypothetical protein